MLANIPVLQIKFPSWLKLFETNAESLQFYTTMHLLQRNPDNIVFLQLLELHSSIQAYYFRIYISSESQLEIRPSLKFWESKDVPNLS